MHYYSRFNHWIQQKKIQKVLDYVNVFSLAGLALFLIFVFHTQLQMIGGLAKEKLATLHVSPTPIPTIPATSPSPTFEQHMQTYTQTQDNQTPDTTTTTDTSPSPIQQSPQQAPALINCYVNANVPDPNPIYAKLTPQQCVSAQAYAVSLWNNTMGHQTQQIRVPQTQYQGLPQQQPIQPPPAIQAPPNIQAPQVQQPASLPYVPTPAKNCYTTIVNPGSPEQVVIPCP